MNRPGRATEALRLLHLPNEQIEGDQIGPRMAFELMQARGTLGEYTAYSFLVEAERQGVSAMSTALIELVGALRPHWVLWQHVGTLPLPGNLLTRMRCAAPEMRLLYHEGDLYGSGKPVPAATRALMRDADVVCLVGRGRFARQVRSFARGVVTYAPSAADTRRFGLPWSRAHEAAFDVVMIGNRVTSRRPWRRLPGAATRAELARQLGRRFGHRFALFGQGWNGFVGWQGPVPYDAQEQAMRQGRVGVAWGHYDDEAAYFSDRLPISMLSGVPQVVNRQPGYEEMFGPQPPLAFAATIDEAISSAEALLAQPALTRIQIGERAAAFARQHLVAEVVYPRLLAEAEALPSRR